MELCMTTRHASSGLAKLWSIFWSELGSRCTSELRRMLLLPRAPQKKKASRRVACAKLVIEAKRRHVDSKTGGNCLKLEWRGWCKRGRGLEHWRKERFVHRINKRRSTKRAIHEWSKQVLCTIYFCSHHEWKSEQNGWTSEREDDLRMVTENSA